MKPPVVSEIRRKDGQPMDPILPQRVTEPVDIGFGEGITKILDFGYAFIPQDGISYTKDSFACGTPASPELVLDGASTKFPFQVDSWCLGLAVCSKVSKAVITLISLDLLYSYRWGKIC